MSAGRRVGRQVSYTAGDPSHWTHPFFLPTSLPLPLLPSSPSSSSCLSLFHSLVPLLLFISCSDLLDSFPLSLLLSPSPLSILVQNNWLIIIFLPWLQGRAIHSSSHRTWSLCSPRPAHSVDSSLEFDAVSIIRAFSATWSYICSEILIF